MIPLTAMLVGGLILFLAALAIPLTVVLFIATALRDNGVLDHRITIWTYRDARRATINPAGWPFWARGALVALTTTLWIAVWQGWTLADRLPTALPRTVLGTALIVGLGSGLFVLKIRRLRVYAIVEITFAILLSAGTMYRMTDRVAPFELAALMAAVYVLIRGMDNLKKDLDTRSAEKAKPSRACE